MLPVNVQYSNSATPPNKLAAPPPANWAMNPRSRNGQKLLRTTCSDIVDELAVARRQFDRHQAQQAVEHVGEAQPRQPVVDGRHAKQEAGAAAVKLDVLHGEELALY